VQFARPPGGFSVTVTRRVQAYIDAEAASNATYPRLLQQWADLQKRLSMVALREGTHLPGEPHNRFIHIADGSVSFGVPTIKTLYSVFGKDLTIYAALIYGDADFDDDDEEAD
jgi:hypothetical protein